MATTLDEPEQAANLAARLASPSSSWHLSTSGAIVCLTTVEQRLLASARGGRIAIYDLRPIWNSEPPRLLSSSVPSCTITHAATCMTCMAGAVDIGGTTVFMGSRATVFCAAGGSEIHLVEVNLDTGVLQDPSPASISRLDTPSRAVVTALESRKGHVYSAGNDLCIRMYDGHSGAMLRVLAEGLSPATSLSFIPDRRQLVSTCHDGAGAISVWRLPVLFVSHAVTRGWCLSLGPVLRQHFGSAHDAATTEPALDTKQAALDCLHTFALAGNQVHTTVQATGGFAAVSASHTGELQVWDLERWRLAGEWTSAHLGHVAPISSLALSGDAVCSASDRELHVTRCPPARPGASPDLYNGSSILDGDVLGTRTAASVEAMLRGVEEASDELAGP